VFENTKEVIRIRKSKKDRYHNGQNRKKDNRTNNDPQYITHKTKDQATRTPLKTNNDLQYITHKTKDRVTRTPLKTGIELRCHPLCYSNY
jgi:hypothetical protein